MGADESDGPIRVTVKPSKGPPLGYLATAPGHYHKAVDLNDAVAWARHLVQRHPFGGYIMVVDEVGLAVSNSYFAHDATASATLMSPDLASGVAEPRTPLEARAFMLRESLLTRPGDIAYSASPDFGAYWQTAEAYDLPFTEIDGLRFRRSDQTIGVELATDHDTWIRWWVFLSEPPTVALAIEQDLEDAVALGKLAAGTPGALLLEQWAPEVVALARYGAGRVDGVPLVAFHLPVPGRLTTFLLHELPALPAGPIGADWARASVEAIDAVQRAVNACGELRGALSHLGPRELRSLALGQQMDWRSQLKQGADVARDIKAGVDLIKAVSDLFSA